MIVIINYYIQTKLFSSLSPDIPSPVGDRRHLRPGGTPPSPRLSPGALGGSQADQNLYRPGQSFVCIYIHQHLSLSRSLQNRTIVYFPFFFSLRLD